MRKLYLSLFAFSILFASLFSSPLLAQQDTAFWFAAPYVNPTISYDDIHLRIITHDSAAVWAIQRPALSNADLYKDTLSPDTSATYSLANLGIPALSKDSLTHPQADTIRPAGIYIHSSEPITVLYEIWGGNSNYPYNFEQMSLKGRGALGSDFMLPGSPLHNHGQKNQVFGHSAADILATEDNTLIKVWNRNALLAADSTNIPANQKIKISLNKGEVYSIKSYGPESRYTLSGTQVSSDKPIAITISDDALLMDTSDAPTDGGGLTYAGQDFMGDQLLPTWMCGTRYSLNEGAAVRLDGVPGFLGDVFFIVSSSTGNLVEISNDSGTYSKTLGQGETWAFRDTANTRHFLESSEPVVVYHMTSSGTQFDGNREPAGSILPPLSNSGSNEVGFSYPTMLYSSQVEKVYLTAQLVVKAGGEDSIYTNFDPHPGFANNDGRLKTFQFRPLSGDSSYMVGTILIDPFYFSTYPAPDTKYYFKGDSLLTGQLIYGATGSDPSGSSTIALMSNSIEALDLPDRKICAGDSTTYDAGPIWDQVTWQQINGSFSSSSALVQISDSGSYAVSADLMGQNFTDTVEVSTVDAPLRPGIQLEGTDTLLAGTVAENYRWYRGDSLIQQGANDTLFADSTLGNYYVIAENYRCQSDTSPVFSLVISTKASVPEQMVKVYPTPAKDYLMVKWSGPESRHVQVELLNAMGQQAYLSNTTSLSPEQEFRLSVQHLEPGLYLLRLVEDQQIREVRKVVVK